MNLQLYKQYWYLFLQTNMGLNVSYKSLFNYLYYTVHKPDKIIKQTYSYPVLSMYITKKCNLHCNYCIVGRLQDGYCEKDYELTPAIFLNILKHTPVSKTLVVNFCGGEPLLNENLPALVRMAREYKKIPTLITNGILLKRQWDDLLSAGIAEIQLSVYGNTVNMLKDDFEYFNKQKKINASYVLLKSDLENNLGQTEEIIDCICNSGFKSLKFNFCVSNGNNMFADEMINEKHIVKYSNFKSKILKKHKKLMIYFPEISRQNGKIHKRCRMPWNTLSLDAAGNLGFCCVHPPDVAETKLNIFQNDWQKVINSDEFIKNRSMLLSKNAEIPAKCKDCCHLYGSYASNI